MRCLLYLAACLLPCASAASAASFDCAKASTPVEKMICADPALSKADETLAETFAAALAATLTPQHLHADQRQWLADRSKLTSADALAIAYRDRIDVLNGDIEQWRAVRRDVSAADIEKTCLVVPDAPDDLTCRVEASGEAENDKARTLRYQLQSYRDGDLRIAGGAVVFESVAGSSGRFAPVAAAYQEAAHYGRPALVNAPAAIFLLIPGSIEGTGNFNAESLYVYDNAKLRPIDTESWQGDLARRLPKGMGAWKGIYPDYATMSAETSLWQQGDANCCPTAGRAAIRLGLRGQRLVIEQLSVTRGAAAARAEKPQAAATAAPDDTDAGTDICGKPVEYAIVVESFREGPARRDKPALETAETVAPVLIHRAFKALCAKQLLSAREVASRIDRVMVGWAGGAGDFNAYFPADKARTGTLMTEWAWTGTAAPGLDDVRTGILCAFKPKQKMCRDREP